MTDKEIKTLEQSAQKGDKKAAAQLNELGVDYQFGNNGKKVDLAQALHYYMIAAEGGNTNAMCNAAYCYATGAAGKVDAGKAFGLYQKAAEAGDLNGMTNLAGCYLNGFGTKQDAVEAIKWLVEALNAGGSIKTRTYKSGNADAVTRMMTLAEDFRHGKNGQKENLPLAYQLYDAATECGDVEARTKVAYCLYNGIGVEKDTKRAFALYEQLANEGNEKGMANVGLMYCKGEGVQKDIQKAIYWSTRAAEELDSVNAMNTLTHIYGEEDGYINNRLALRWFSRLVDIDSDDQSLLYHNTQYDKVLCQKIYRLFENAISESKTPYRLQDRLDTPDTNRSLFSEPVYFCLDESREHLLPLIMESDSWGKTPQKERKQSTKLQDLDPMFELVAQWVVEQQEASTSKLQRVFEISYNRAGKLMSQLEATGVINDAFHKPTVLVANKHDIEQLLSKLK